MATPSSSSFLFRHIHHDLTRPTLLLGPGGCGKRSYCEAVLTEAKYEIVKLGGDRNIIAMMQDLACGRGLVPRAVLVTGFDVVLKDKQFLWKKLIAAVHALNRRRIPVLAVADSGDGCKVASFAPAVKHTFYVVMVKPPDAGQIVSILSRKEHLNKMNPSSTLTRQQKAGLTSYIDQVAETCQGDVRQAILALSNRTNVKSAAIDSAEAGQVLDVLFNATNMKYMYKHSSHLEQCSTRQFDDLVDAAGISFFFDNYLALPLQTSRCAQTADMLTHVDILSASNIPYDQHTHNVVAGAFAQLCSFLGQGGRKRWEAFMKCKRSNSHAATVANKTRSVAQTMQSSSVLNYQANCAERLEISGYLAKLVQSGAKPETYGLTEKSVAKLTFHKPVRLKKR